MSEQIFDDMWLSKQAGFESPIEDKLYRYLTKVFPEGSIEKQKTIGKYRVDFFVPPRFVIEADGQEFHNEEKDCARDSDPCFNGMIIIRCSGKLIHAYPKMVARRIKEITEFYRLGKVRATGWRTWRLYHLDQIPQIGERT